MWVFSLFGGFFWFVLGLFWYCFTTARAVGPYSFMVVVGYVDWGDVMA